MEILSVEFAQAIILRIKELKERDRYKHIKGHEDKLKKEATDDVFRQFVAEQKLNLLPKPLLQSSWLKQIKTGREYPMYGYEQSKNIIRADHDMSSLSQKMDKGGSLSG